MQTRKRVLINAFTVRALRDTFSPARGAGIMALCATSGYYDSAEIATRILPNVVVLTIDPDSDVRLKSFQAVDQFLQILKQNNEKEISGDTAAGGLNIPSLPGNASLLGWAMSSLTLKGKPSEHSSSAPVSSNAPLGTTSSDSISVENAQTTAPVRVSSSFDLTEQHATESPTSTDGWGEVENGIHDEDETEKDGWDELEPLDEPKPSPALANIQAAQKRPVSQPVSQTKPPSSRSARPAKEDDDLWGSIAAPAPRTVSKPLNVKSSAPVDDDDPWAAIAAPAPSTRAKPLSAGRGRGSKAAAPKLGAQRINRTSSSGRHPPPFIFSIASCLSLHSRTGEAEPHSHLVSSLFTAIARRPSQRSRREVPSPSVSCRTASPHASPVATTHQIRASLSAHSRAVCRSPTTMRHVSPPFDPPSPSQAARLHTSSRTRAINSSCPSREAEPFFTSRAARVQAEPSLTRDYSSRARPSRAPLTRDYSSRARPSRAPLTRDYSSRARPSRAPLTRDYSSRARPSRAPLTRDYSSRARPSRAPLTRDYSSRARPSRAPLTRDYSSRARPSRAPLTRDYSSRARPSRAPLTRDYSSRARPSRAPLTRDYSSRARPSRAPLTRDYSSRARPSRAPLTRDYSSRARPSRAPLTRDFIRAG
uniref:Uncharacterized protein n=1 Tax=Cucumis sativus TaxID=3659 RepID=A0A0A0LBV8_CUCSA